MKKEDGVLVVFGIIFVVAISMIFVGNVSVTGASITGLATEGTTVSNVTIAKFLAIEFSVNLTDGIFFGTVNALPSTDVNATHDYDGVGLNTTFFVNVSDDSNTEVDFCIKGNTDLTDSVGGDVIGLGNETYSNSSINNAVTAPAVGEQVALTTSYVKSSAPTGAGNVTFYRFWLDVPAGTASGTYNNTVSIKGVETATAC